MSAAALTFQLPNGKIVHTMKVILPARPFLGISGDDRVGIELLVDRYEEAAAA